jgi:hypothetical protein
VGRRQDRPPVQEDSRAEHGSIVDKPHRLDPIVTLNSLELDCS